MKDLYTRAYARGKQAQRDAWRAARQAPGAGEKLAASMERAFASIRASTANQVNLAGERVTKKATD